MTIRRKYSKEFKQEAVEMSNVAGITLMEKGEKVSRLFRRSGKINLIH